MGKNLRRYGAGAVAGAIVGVTAFGPVAESAFTAGPATADMSAVVANGQRQNPGLTADPRRLLPAVISPTHPVRVVSTALDHTGRPVVTARTATDRSSATDLVRTGQSAEGAVGVELDVPVRATDDGAAPTVPSRAGTTDTRPLNTGSPGAGSAGGGPVGDDPFRSAQWDLATVRATEAWATATGAGVTVAVIDSGVDASHPDLAGQVLPGADYITGLEGTAVDPHGHGTHVAGTIAALAGNGVGVAGLAPEAHILPVRVLSASGGGYMSDVANGIVYAADHGADVINMSISAGVPVEAVTAAVGYARGKGIVVVAAAGNARGSGSPASYPAAEAGVIAVAATDSADAVAGYSTRGGYVDVAAPGTGILSTYPVATGSPYGRMNGTSMAAPHVAAVAALLKSRDRGLSPDQIEQAIVSSAVDLGAPGRDDDFGAGRIDAAAALATLAPPAPATAPPAATDLFTTDPAIPSPTEPAPTDTAPADPTPTPTEPAPEGPTPTGPAPESPAPSTATPAPTTPEPAPSQTPSDAVVRLVRTRPGQLTIVITGADGRIAELQRNAGVSWVTAQTFTATLVTRINGLPAGQSYRVVVDNAVSGTVRV